MNIFLIVSGVVLANASLDIAFHDTVKTVTFIIITKTLFIMANTVLNMYNFSLNMDNEHNATNILDNNDYEEYIKMF